MDGVGCIMEAFQRSLDLDGAASKSRVVGQETEPGAAKNGSVNKLLPDDRPVHDWYRFVLSFPPHFVRDYLTKLGAGADQLVLDPFCGTGTTLVECKKLGIPSVGIERNAMAHFASQVKVDWTPDPDGLAAHAGEVAERAHAELEAQGIGEGPLFSTVSAVNARLLGLEPEQEKLLLADSISPIPLHKTLVLIDCLNQMRDDRYYRHEVLALAKGLVQSIGNLKFGPEVGVGPAKADAPVLDVWLSQVRAVADDLRVVSGLNVGESKVYCADSRRLLEHIAPNSIDVVITSPPYPNEKDYTRTTRLESVLLGFIKSRADLREMKRGLVRSNTRGIYKEDDDDQWVAGHEGIQRIAREIEARRTELGKTSGFERMYARAAKLYFGGMARHLADLRLALRPGARLAYVVGDQASYLRVMIRTGQILAEIAEGLGYEVSGIDLFRTRLATATREQLREEVLLLQWPGE